LKFRVNVFYERLFLMALEKYRMAPPLHVENIHESLSFVLAYTIPLGDALLDQRILFDFPFHCHVMRPTHKESFSNSLSRFEALFFSPCEVCCVPRRYNPFLFRTFIISAERF